MMADGVGCALAAVGALAIGRLGDELDPISSARIPLGAALAARARCFSVQLVTPATETSAVPPW